MTFDINTLVPFGPHVPKSDVPEMRQNFDHINSGVAVDHVAPGATNNWQHKFVRFPSYQLPPGPILDASVVYTQAFVDAGNVQKTAFSGLPNLTFQNQKGALPLANIKSYGCFSFDGIMTCTILNGYNFNPTFGLGDTWFTITMPAPLTGSNDYAVLMSCVLNNQNDFISSSYSIVDATSFKLFFRQASNPYFPKNGISFVVLQF